MSAYTINPSYKALSYTWGGNIKQNSVILNGMRFLVTQNLFDALQHLQSKKEMSALWIDAICINQEDKSEKEVQVSLMKNIYEQSKEVIVWLGKEADESGLALEAISNASKSHLFQGQQSCVKTMNNPEVVTALKNLFSRPWWSRIWITQEATCPNTTITVMCREAVISFTELVSATSYILNQILSKAVQDGFDTPDVLIFHRVISLHQLRLKRAQNGPDINTLWLFEDCRVCSVTDDRDRIYAPLGITDFGQRHRFKPKYTWDIRKSLQ
jgi:heterokaryon incompatibility protein (HET)